MEIPSMQNIVNTLLYLKKGGQISRKFSTDHSLAINYYPQLDYDDYQSSRD